jgi:hypothetical protein
MLSRGDYIGGTCEQYMYRTARETNEALRRFGLTRNLSE